jgi:hypothetical protein
MDGIQEAFNNAMAQVMGHRNADDLIQSIPEEYRLKGNPTRQEQFNHALALKQGFDSVQDLVDAKGMDGTRGLKGREF